MQSRKQMIRPLLALAILLGFALSSSQAQQRDPRNVATQQQPAAQAPAATRPIHAPAAPFQLTPVQQRILHEVLLNYERETGKIKTFSAELVKMEFDPVFGPKDTNQARSTGKGILQYTKPDKAKYEISNVQIYDGKTGKYVPNAAATEFVVVNGKEVIVKDFQKKQVHVTPLPEEMQGQGIFYGPLPFVFGAKAVDLERRYFLRLTTPEPAAKAGQIWLEAYPRFQVDAASYKRVDLIIRQADMMPLAIQVHNPNGKNRTVYTFANQKIDPFVWNPFADEYKVSTPFGWKRFVEKPPTPATRQAANPGRPAQR